MRKLNWKCLVLSVFLSVGVLMGNLFAQAEPQWKVTFQGDVKWLKITHTGHLVVSTNNGLAGLNPENGEIIWKKADIKGLDESNFQIVQLTRYALLKLKAANDKTNYFSIIDVVDGNEIWTSESMDLRTSERFLVLPEIGRILIYGEELRGKRYFVQGKAYLLRKAAAADLKTGERTLESQDILRIDPFVKPFFDTKQTMITYMTDRNRICKLDAGTGEVIWESSLKSASARPLLLNDTRDVVYAVSSKTIYALTTEEGRLVWKRPPRLKGTVHQVELTPKSLVVRGGRYVVYPNKNPVIRGEPFITLLDAATGRPIWNDPFTELKNSTNFVLNDDKVVVYSDKKLLSINLSGGAVNVIAKGIKFKGKERPRSIRLQHNGYLLQSSNNLMLVSFDGEKLYHVYHKAPGYSLGQKIFFMAATIAVNEAAKLAVRELTKEMVKGAGKIQDPNLFVLSLAAIQPLYQYSYENSLDQYLYENVFDHLVFTRFRATRNLETYTYILTHIKAEGAKGRGLVKVNKINGKTEAQIVLGTKNPLYEIDEIESRLFFKSGKKEIVCYKF